MTGLKLGGILALLLLMFMVAFASAQVEVLEAADGYRLVKHALGETRVPADAERVVVLFPGHLDAALALGVTPVGVGRWAEASNGYLNAYLEGVPDVGASDAYNLEAILALQPDLILAPAEAVGDSYAQLSRVAPTVAPSVALLDRFPGYFWDTARVLGREARAAELMRDYEEALADLRETAGARGKAALVMVNPEAFRVYGEASVARVLYDAGFEPSNLTRSVGAEDNLPVSEEVLPTLDAAHLFVISRPADFLEDVARRPVWERLEAVRAGNVHRVDETVWLGGGYLAQLLMLDDVRAALTGEQP